MSGYWSTRKLIIKSYCFGAQVSPARSLRFGKPSLRSLAGLTLTLLLRLPVHFSIKMGVHFSIKIYSFTRHDSIVVASGYEEKTEQIITGVFADFGFKYNHKIEDKFWEVVDYDELEQSDYMQWLINENVFEQDFYFDESDEDPIENESENIYDLDEEQMEVFDRLMEIGIRDDYYEYVDADFLEEIVLLPFLNEQQRNVLYDDINNLHHDMSFLQEDTNKLLRRLLSKGEKKLDIP